MMVTAYREVSEAEALKVRLAVPTAPSVREDTYAGEGVPAGVLLVMIMVEFAVRGTVGANTTPVVPLAVKVP